MDIAEFIKLQKIMHPDEVLWVRTPDFKKQVFVSDSYERIWERKTEGLYTNPLSFMDTLVPDTFAIRQMNLRIQGRYEETQCAVFKIHTTSGVKFIVDNCFKLYKNNEFVAVAGIARQVSEETWREVADSETHLMTKENDLLKRCNDALGRSIEEKPTTIDELLSPLSTRERQCLHHTIYGKTAKEIGNILNISSKTVEIHLGSIRKKLECYSKSQLIEKVITAGYFN